MGIQADMERFVEDRVLYTVICLQLKKQGTILCHPKKETGNRPLSPFGLFDLTE